MKTLFIIFGATGDLAKRKLFPAGYEIFRKRKLTGAEDQIRFLSIGRREFTDEAFREYLAKECDDFIEQKQDFSDFLENVEYQKVEMTTRTDYQSLGHRIMSHTGEDTQIIIYLSIAPEHFENFVDHYTFLNITCPVKVVFEKPFGTDLESSKALNERISKVFSEDQIYRIDHYVGKEAIQNIFAFRFSNVFFEPVWNAQYIDHIEIIASELIGVGNRGGYYDHAGALRDMVQNHLLQVLSLMIMDEPEFFQDECIRAEKLKVLRALSLDPDFTKSVVFGQYEGYLEEPGVRPNSRTETFVSLNITIDTPRWKGVPVSLKTGKYLDKRQTHIIVTFREVTHHIFDGFKKPERNRIVIDIQPNESIRLEFNVKEIGNAKKTRKVESLFTNTLKGEEAYEKLLSDVIIGDKTLFASFDILIETWRIIDELVNCKNNCPILFSYKPGSPGPVIHT